MKTNLKLSLIGLVLSTALVGCASSRHGRGACQYRVVQGVTDTTEFEAKLNQAGLEGFDIISTTLIPREPGFQQQALVILKREHH